VIISENIKLITKFESARYGAGEMED